MPDEIKPNPSASEPPGGPQRQPEFTVDTSALSTNYANFCRVTGTPEELVLDFGLNTQMSPVAGGEPVKLTHRLVLNFYTAKRLLGALHMAVQQHENVYGILEVDIQKRMRSAPRVGPRPGGGFAPSA
jgi:Protein of unknown function (DUF3467)